MLQEKAQDRERLLLKFIKIMKVKVTGPHSPLQAAGPISTLTGRISPQHLRKLNNFNSYLAILSALDSAPIRRLEWQKQTSEVGGQEAIRWVGQAQSCSATSLWLGSCLPHLSPVSGLWPLVPGLRGCRRAFPSCLPASLYLVPLLEGFWVGRTHRASARGKRQAAAGTGWAPHTPRGISHKMAVDLASPQA